MTEMVQSAAPSVADVLNYAADLVAKPGAWIQGDYARSASDRSVASTSDEAVCFCAVGAVIAARDRLNARGLATTCDIVIHARRVLQPGVHDAELDPLSQWNDHPDRTQEEVVDVLRRAAQVARC